MALRKKYQRELSESKTLAIITPFEYGLDNGKVELYGDKPLTYDDVAELYGMCFPEKSYKCVDGVGVEIPNFATLSEEEREIMYQRFPELRPKEAIGE